MTFSDSAFDQFNKLLKSASAEEKSHRQKGWDAFQHLGLPARKDEEWKYSSLKTFSNRPWALSPEAQVSSQALALRERLHFQFDVLILVNGRPALADSRLSDPTIEIRPLEWTGSSAMGDGLKGLVTALAQDGIRIEIAGGAKPKKPLAIIYDQSPGDFWAVSRSQVCLRMGSELHLAEFLIGGGQGWRSHQAEVNLEAGAHMHWLRIVREASEAQSVSHSTATLDRDAVLNYSLIHSGSSWSRGDWSVDIRGEGATAGVYGLNFGRSNQHADQRVVVNHWCQNTQSAQLFKGILKDTARGVLNGRIFIAQDAQKVNSSQYNHNLLLSKGAEANTKPELEIFADDVKANHGASIGRMDENKLFYLMSRGIRRQEAQQMLAKAFVLDVLMKIQPKLLRAEAETAVREILPDFAAEMEATT